MWRTPARLVERTLPGPASRTRVPAGTVVRSPKTTTPPARLETFRAATALRAAPGRARAGAAGARAGAGGGGGGGGGEGKEDREAGERREPSHPRRDHACRQHDSKSL